MELIGGEKLMYRARLHWVVLARPAARLAFGLAAAAALRGWPPLQAAALALAASALPALIRYRSTEFLVTNHRLCVRRGLMRRGSAEIVINRIASIGAAQGLSGRLLGYGSLNIRGLGPDETLRHVAGPELLRRKIHEAVAAHGRFPELEAVSEEPIPA